MANEFSKVPVDEGAILLTGATGLLGGEVLARILARTDRTVVALVRRPLHFEHPRLKLLMADLTEDAPLPTPDVPISQVIHCAASVSFTLPIEEQREINVDGTRRLLELAATFPSLERFMHVSTCYVAGTFEGTFGPEDLERGQGFRNTYEQSKHEAEVLVRGSGLPTQVVRPAIVVGDQYTGRTNAFNVLYPPMKAYAMGKMHVAPGRIEAPVDVVPIDYVADAMMELLDVEPAARTSSPPARTRRPSVSSCSSARTTSSARSGRSSPRSSSTTSSRSSRTARERRLSSRWSAPPMCCRTSTCAPTTATRSRRSSSRRAASSLARSATTSAR